MSQQHDDQQPEDSGKKKKNQIIFAISSCAALVIVGLIGYFILSKIKEDKNLASDLLLQEQFEGDPQISFQLQSECQNSAIKIAKFKDTDEMESEYRRNVENCKDISISIEFDSFIRKEGSYGDIAVDIAKQIVGSDKNRAIDLLTYARDLKTWDFYLGPTSCESQHVLDAYVEAFSVSDERTCVTRDDVPHSVAQEVTAKNFSSLSRIAPQNEVVWLGAPESELGCPEKMLSVIEILKKLTSGPISADVEPVEHSETTQINVNIKLSDKENITLVLQGEPQCLTLSSVLVPNPDVVE